MKNTDLSRFYSTLFIKKVQLKAVNRIFSRFSSGQNRDTLNYKPLTINKLSRDNRDTFLSRNRDTLLSRLSHAKNLTIKKLVFALSRNCPAFLEAKHLITKYLAEIGLFKFGTLGGFTKSAGI